MRMLRIRLRLRGYVLASLRAYAALWASFRALRDAAACGCACAAAFYALIFPILCILPCLHDKSAKII